ncbi:MAG: hypothetical protein IJ740_18570 [Ruminococcus sp.]|nr:hypothetical protein [Ruminococcus sp.]
MNKEDVIKRLEKQASDLENVFDSLVNRMNKPDIPEMISLSQELRQVYYHLFELKYLYNEAQ